MNFIKRKIKNRLRAIINDEINRISVLEDNVQANNELIVNLDEEVNFIGKEKKVIERITALEASNIVERTKTLEVANMDIVKRTQAIESADLVSRTERIEENMRNNNIVIADIVKEVNIYKEKCSDLEKANDMLIINMAKRLTDEKNKEQVQQTKPEKNTEAVNEYISVDYFDFENTFRGSRKTIKKNQEIYVPYFESKKKVIDIGCGRGEFLELMRENDIIAKGVDSYEAFTEFCKLKDLDVVLGDGIEYLSAVDDTDGIFVGQVVEHLKNTQVIELCNLAYQKLNKGSVIIIETPNPMSLAIYTNSFYLDPSHNKPVHPLTLKYYLEKTGFTDIEIIFTEESKDMKDVPKFFHDEDSDEKNKIMEKVCERLFGSQDYAIVARK